MTQEVYFNRDELNLFKKTTDQFSIESGVDFLLPNSFESSGGNFLQKVRLTRRFQRTLASIRSDSDQRDSGVSTLSQSQSSNEELEDFLFNEKYDETKRAALEHFFFEWRSLVDIR